ncbi:hypothetical protein [Algibacter sp. PT7-4]|uniref:hypothetical protein n=1 Tax=Algibacter ulvanivorans TaxID=3400999 RepID=UPI003AADAAE2
MKISFTVLAILVTLSIIVPFLIFIFKGFNTSTKKEVRKLAQQNGYKYDLKEVWNNKFIGITENKNTLTYITVQSENNTFINLNLSEISNCEVLTKYQTGSNKVSLLKQLDLKLSFKNTEKQDVLLNFFNTDETFMEDYELRRIKNWQDIITSNLSHNLVIKKAS